MRVVSSLRHENARGSASVVETRRDEYVGIDHNPVHAASGCEQSMAKGCGFKLRRKPELTEHQKLTRSAGATATAGRCA
jgi:hypothetical protein